MIITDIHRDISNVAFALSHPARLAVIDYLAMNGHARFSTIHAHLELSVATVFQHLVVLLKHGLISETKVGKTKYYYINEKTYLAIKKLSVFVDKCSQE